jgi:nucleoid DNA-binding protein
MSLGKFDISNNIISKAQLSKVISKTFLESFLTNIKQMTYKGSVKIANFGTFSRNLSPERIGRNPQTRQEFKIVERTKLKYKTSKKIKKIIN